MKKYGNKVILYLGLNSFLEHKRGVENVVILQSRTFNFETVYYIHWGTDTTVYRNDRFICISIKHCFYWPIILNIVLFKLKRKEKLIIHSHNYLFSFFLLFKTDIFTVHDALYYLEKSKKRKFVFHFKIIEFLLYFRCYKVHFISFFAKEQSLFGKYRKNYVIIYNSTPLENYFQISNNEKSISDVFDILIVRSLEERARIDLVIDVAQIFQNRNRKINFVIVGKGPLLTFYKNIIKRKGLKNIKLLGYVPDNELVCLYQKCEMVLMIAEYGEGFGLPIIEGYVFNKPVIASKCCAIPEVIFSEEYLFNNNINDIINKIDFVIENNKQDFRNYYLQKFSQTIILNQYNDLYNTLYLS